MLTVFYFALSTTNAVDTDIAGTAQYLNIGVRSQYLFIDRSKDTSKNAPHRRAGSVLPYSRDDETYICHQPWNREVHSRPVCEAHFSLK